MSIFFGNLIHQESALVYIDDVFFMSNCKPHMLQPIQQQLDIVKKNLKLAPEKLFFMLLTVRCPDHETEFNTNKSIFSKLAAILKNSSLNTKN